MYTKVLRKYINNVQLQKYKILSNIPFYNWLWVCCNLNHPLNISSIPNCFINVLVSIKPYSQIGFLLFQNPDEFTFGLCIIGMVNNCTRICTLVIFGRLMDSDSLKMRCKYYHRRAYEILLEKICSMYQKLWPK